MSQLSIRPRKRVYIACSNCRKAKVKCKTDEQETKPCKRCIRKRLDCEYLTVAEEIDGRSAEPSISAGFPESMRGFGPPNRHSSRSVPSNPGSAGFPPPPEPSDFGTASRGFNNDGHTFANPPRIVQPQPPPQYATPAPQDQGYYPYPWSPVRRPPFYPRSLYVPLHEPSSTAEVNAGIAFARPDLVIVVGKGDLIAFRRLFRNRDTNLDKAEMLFTPSLPKTSYKIRAMPSQSQKTGPQGIRKNFRHVILQMSKTD
ncbi:hypothetical protein C8R45DRAFT_929251 [Mycena sanguinolenta]|nr:hypothetical protein C8R45DRAFT_929251 [Mycena sanguinolenta]